MAVIYLPYLFSEIAFKKRIEPIIPQLEEDNFEALLGMARETLDNNPELWNALYNLNIGFTFEDEAEKTTPHTLLMKVLVQFLEPIEVPQVWLWIVLEHVLPMIGWSDVDTRTLIVGESLCTLLAPDVHQPPKEFFSRAAYKESAAPWCEGSVGWLGQEKIRKYRHLLLKSKSEFYRLSNNPPKTIGKARHGLPDYPKEWLCERLIPSYEAILHVYDLAFQQERSLVLGIA